MSASCSIEPDFPKVGQLRPLVLALFDRTAELREADHRHVQLLGELLQAAADFGDFLDAVFVGVAARSLQQLQIVDDDDPDVLLAA